MPGLGGISTVYGWHWAEAESEFERALDLNPSSFSARSSYGFYLMVMGRSNESIAEMRRAQEIAPLDVVGISMAVAYYFEREYDRALKEIRRALELEPDVVPNVHGLLSWIYGKGNVG